jgi:hypothetical protein
MHTAAFALLLAVILAGCSGSGSETPTGAPVAQPTGDANTPSGSSAPARPIPPVITPDDDGGVYAMEVGASSRLVVDDPSSPDPVVDGTSVEVIGFDNIDASGRREWELTARQPGRTVIRGSGSSPYAITIDVAG